jgi:hypothetical protein
MWAAGFLEELNVSVSTSAHMKEAAYFSETPETRYDAIWRHAQKNINNISAVIKNLKH